MNGLVKWAGRTRGLREIVCRLNSIAPWTQTFAHSISMIINNLLASFCNLELQDIRHTTYMISKDL